MSSGTARRDPLGAGRGAAAVPRSRGPSPVPAGCPRSGRRPIAATASRRSPPRLRSGRPRRAPRAAGRCPGSRDRPMPSAPRPPGRRASWSISERAPWRMPGRAAGERRRVPPGLDAVARRLDDREPDRWLADEPREQADRIRATADAGDREVRQPALDGGRAAPRPRRRSGAGGRARSSGTGAGPSPSRARSGSSRTFVTQSRIASLIASLSVARARRDRADLRAERAHPQHVRAPGARCPRRPCRRRTAARAARTPSRSRRRAGRRRSRR